MTSFENAELNDPAGDVSLKGRSCTLRIPRITWCAPPISRPVRSTPSGQGRRHGHECFRNRQRQVAPNSPWDLLAHEGIAYMALTTGWSRPNATTWGSCDVCGFGPGKYRRWKRLEAALAQDKRFGSTIEGDSIADSETSSIRAVDSAPDGNVTTLVGKGFSILAIRRWPVWWCIAAASIRCSLAPGPAVYCRDHNNSKLKVINPGECNAQLKCSRGQENQHEKSLIEHGGVQ